MDVSYTLNIDVYLYIYACMCVNHYLSIIHVCVIHYLSFIHIYVIYYIDT